jgi:hypothetical protein
MAVLLWNIKDSESRKPQKGRSLQRIHSPRSLEGAMKHDSKPGPENSVSAKSTKGPLTNAAGDQRGAAAEQSRAWHTLSGEEVSRALHTDPASGLTDAEAARRCKQFGPNALARRRADRPGRPVAGGRGRPDGGVPRGHEERGFPPRRERSAGRPAEHGLPGPPARLLTRPESHLGDWARIGQRVVSIRPVLKTAPHSTMPSGRSSVPFRSSAKRKPLSNPGQGDSVRAERFLAWLMQ